MVQVPSGVKAPAVTVPPGARPSLTRPEVSPWSCDRAADTQIPPRPRRRADRRLGPRPLQGDGEATGQRAKGLEVQINSLGKIRGCDRHPTGLVEKVNHERAALDCRAIWSRADKASSNAKASSWPPRRQQEASHAHAGQVGPQRCQNQRLAQNRR